MKCTVSWKQIWVPARTITLKTTIKMAQSLRTHFSSWNPLFSHNQECHFPLCALQLKSLRIITRLFAMFTISHNTLFTEKVLKVGDQSGGAPERGGQREGRIEREESCHKMNPADSRSEHKRHSREWIVKDECVVSYGSQTPFFLQDGWSSTGSRWHYSPRNNPVNREIALCTDTIHKKIEGGKWSECVRSLARERLIKVMSEAQLFTTTMGRY